MSVEQKIRWWDRGLPFTYDGDKLALASAVEKFGSSKDDLPLWRVDSDTLWPRNSKLEYDLTVEQYAESLARILRALGRDVVDNITEHAIYLFIYFDGYADISLSGSLVLVNRVVILQYIDQDGDPQLYRVPL